MLFCNMCFMVFTTNIFIINHREVDEFVKLLCDLRVWQTIEIRGGIDGLLLNPTFRKNLKGALLGGYVSFNDYILTHLN